jgi:hypothetical protein
MPMQIRQRSGLPKELQTSATAGLNLAVAALTVLTAAALHSGWLFLLGAAAYAALVAWDASSARRAEDGLAPAPALPAAAELSDEETARLAARMHAARARLRGALAAAPESVQAQLVMARASVADLEGRAARLLGRAEQLTRCLAESDPDAVGVARRLLVDRIERATDAEAREHYRGAVAAHEEHARALADLAAARERVLGSLARIVATLEALPAQVMRMSALDAQASDQLSHDVNQELTALHREISGYEETLKAIVEVSPS